MAWINDFLEKLFPVKEKYGGADASSVVIDIPAELYYKELAVYTASSLISNAISRSEIRTFEAGVPVKKRDYFLLNVSPNRNETSSVFWHKVINRVIRNGEALVVEAGNYLYCADSYTRAIERPILGDVYECVTIGNLTLDKKFTQDDSYLFRLDNINVKVLIDGMYAEYGKILSSAAKSLKQSNGRKYKLHIEGTKAGDDEFNAEFENYIKKQLKTYMESDNAVYPEFDGYKLEADPTYGTGKSGSAGDFVSLKKELFSSVAGAFHIPESMMTGNITNMSDIIGSFLTFGADPYADMITEALNKVAGLDNYLKGNYYQVDTSRILHRDAFDVSADVSNLISSGVKCIDEVREMLGDAPLNTDWSRRHFITKNFEEIERFLTSTEKGGE
jgi:HK97 family phage portal protein